MRSPGATNGSKRTASRSLSVKCAAGWLGANVRSSSANSWGPGCCGGINAGEVVRRRSRAPRSSASVYGRTSGTSFPMRTCSTRRSIGRRLWTRNWRHRPMRRRSHKRCMTGCRPDPHSIEEYAARSSRLRTSEVQFALARKRADSFAERWSELERLNDAVESRAGVPILVEGCAGSGKSTLVSRLWVERVGRGDRIFGRFAAEGGDRNPRMLMHGLLRELLVEAGQAAPAPRADSVAISRFGRFLPRALCAIRCSAHRRCR